MTDRAKAMDKLIAQDADLIDKLRDTDSYYRLQEKHWCVDHEELERQRLAAADLIETQAREIERLRGLLLKAADWLKVAPIESGICCCGDPIDGHDYYNGHSPVDAVQYSAMELHKEIHAALAGDSHDQ